MKRIPKKHLRMFKIIIVLLLGVSLTSVLFAQRSDNVKREIFRKIDTELESARKADVPMLAPTLYSRTMKHYKKADEVFNNSESLDKIQKRINQTLESLRKSVEVASTTKQTLAEVLEARQHVLLHEYISNKAPRNFNEAEKQLQEAIYKAEKGDTRGAKKKGRDALKKYREATIFATEKSLLKEASTNLKKSKRKLSAKQYTRTTRDLKLIESRIQKAKEQEFNILDLIDDITSGMPATTRNPQYQLEKYDHNLGKATIKPLVLWAQQGSGTFATWVTTWKDSEFPASLKVQTPVTVMTIEPGDTQFSLTDLHPELLEQMQIQIDLESYKTLGVGGDEDPFFFIAVVYADGTTIIPYYDWITRDSLYFSPKATMRIDSPSKTHGNVPCGAMGESLSIPASTGHFEKIIKPIGLRLADQFQLSSHQRKGLRDVTQVGIIVVGFEEDAIPSTEVVNSCRELFIQRLNEELNGLIPEKIPVGNLQIPDIHTALSDIKAALKQELIDFAESEGMDEAWIKIGLMPGWFLFPGVLNQDDYIGQDLALFTYQQILYAGTEGIPFKMLLDQNCKCDKPWYIQNDMTETIYYRIKGRIRLILDE